MRTRDRRKAPSGVGVGPRPVSRQQEATIRMKPYTTTLVSWVNCIKQEKLSRITTPVWILM